MKRLRRLGRALLLWCLRLLPRGQGGAVPTPPRSVLVVRTDDRVGNLLLTTPLLAALREAFPLARIGLLCAARRAPVVVGTGLYDELWAFEKRTLFQRPWAFVAFCWRLRRARYQVAIDAGHFHAFSFTSAALARWSGAPVRIGHSRGLADRFLTHAIEKDRTVSYDAAAKLELLRPFGILNAPLRSLQTALGMRQLVAWQALIGDGFVVNPGGRKPDHRWSATQFAEAAGALSHSLGVTCFVSWGPGEEALARSVADAAGARLLPQTDLDGLAAAFRAASLVLTNDTGPMHLAVAVGAPLVAIFLGDNSERWLFPQREIAAVRARGRSAGEVLAEVLATALRVHGAAASTQASRALTSNRTLR